MQPTADIRGRAITAAAAAGAAVIVVVSVATALAERGRDLDGSGWLVLPFAALLAAYALAGRTAARAAPHAPMTHGSLAALGAYTCWLVIRVSIPLVRGDGVGVTPSAVLFHAMLAAALGMLGASLAERRRR